MVGREGIDPRKLNLIPYGQSRTRFDAVTAKEVASLREDLGLGARSLLVCVGRLHPEKGHRHLLEAFAQLRSEGFSGVLCLVGVGAEEAVLRALVRSLRIEEDVAFLGWRDDVLTIIASADLVIHPSLHEALPSAVIEAVALARPIVASDVSGVRDVLGDSEFGLVVPPGDTRALVEGLRMCLGDLSQWRMRAAIGAGRLFNEMSAARTAYAHTEIYLSEARASFGISGGHSLQEGPISQIRQ
jgi:glycosyltransferase involved in cell wall biosynthesis